MVLKGGVGFHMVDIAVRFGPDAVAFFYKVSALIGLTCLLGLC